MFFGRHAVMLTLTALLLVPLFVSSQERPRTDVPAVTAEDRLAGDWGGWHWQMMQDGWHGGFGYGHWGFSLLFWGLILVALVLAVRAIAGSGRGREPQKTALEILEDRYARGEIDRDEYCGAETT